MAVTAMLLSGCATVNQTTPPSPATSSPTSEGQTSNPSITLPSPVPLPSAPATTTESGQVPSQTQPRAPATLPSLSIDVEVQVLRVIDGDTIEVSLNGRSYTVRYIGVDTPETVDPNRPAQPFGIEASNKNKTLVAGKTVRLEKDVSETDRYGRLLRYVYVGNILVNAELVRLGYAQVATYPPDVKYQNLFLQLQSEAREANRGLWGLDASVPTQPSSSSPPAVSAGQTVEIVSITSPVKPGANATLIAQTTPGADCSITVYYKSGPSSASGLGATTADSSGRVSWTWKVGTSTTPGSWRVVVKATSGGASVTQETYLVIQ